MDKKKYVLHISALKFYLQHGLRLKKVHRAISFKQAHFLKPFIEFNTEKRNNNANNDFEKDLFELMNNSVYGKTMENVRKHGDFEIVNTPERFQKLVNKPLFKHRHIINEDLVIVETDKHTVELNKPIYMGMSILDYSKIHMYSFYNGLNVSSKRQTTKVMGSLHSIGKPKPHLPIQSSHGRNEPVAFHEKRHDSKAWKTTSGPRFPEMG